ncbi:MAG: RagB/SusD family nutrient uptake outer membrane protein, partial [Segetibacter sp.]
MKNKTIRLLSISTVAITLLLVAACKKKFLDQKTVGLLTEVEAGSLKGANQFLIGTYAQLKGIGWEGGISNWVYGSIVGGEANKGSDAGDQAAIIPIQNYTPSPTNGYFNTKWRALYEGVARANGTLRILAKLTTADIADADKTQLTAEARFLRGFYHFEAKKMWNKIPFVDEKISVTESKVPNTADVWPLIMADLDFARNNLAVKPSAIGRINKWGAMAFAAKALLYQGKFAEARTIFTD